MCSYFLLLIADCCALGAGVVDGVVGRHDVYGGWFDVIFDMQG